MNFLLIIRFYTYLILLWSPLVATTYEDVFKFKIYIFFLEVSSIKVRFAKHTQMADVTKIDVTPSSNDVEHPCEISRIFAQNVTNADQLYEKREHANVTFYTSKCRYRNHDYSLITIK